jgi:glycosyltransferase involved in cell wall biosynthesis
MARRARHASVGLGLAPAIPWPVEALLPNPYDETVFRLDKEVARDMDVAFVGRLIEAKGAQILVEALAILERNGIALSASIIGDGPELKRLREDIAARGLERRVGLRGLVIGSELARLLNRHRILVVPSLCPEGFGLVALEGIACGCIVVGSNWGGLPEAIGSCGATFPTGNAESLARTLGDLLGSPSKMQGLRAGAEQHLAKHRPGVVARRYLEFINELGGARNQASQVRWEKHRRTESVECVSS